MVTWEYISETKKQYLVICTVEVGALWGVVKEGSGTDMDCSHYLQGCSPLTLWSAEFQRKILISFIPRRGLASGGILIACA